MAAGNNDKRSSDRKRLLLVLVSESVDILLEMAPLLDHIVILLPQPALDSLPSWLTDAFTVIKGGQHAGGTTANQLVLLADGVYLELIAFVGTDEGRRAHRWGAEPEGHVIDWALSLAGESVDAVDKQFSGVQKQVAAAGVGLEYKDLVAGGRTRPDGEVLKWATSAPADTASSTDLVGVLPFWCLDRTPRRLRVPYEDNDGTLAQHPSQAAGVSSVTLRVADAALRDRLRKAYDAVLPRTAEDEWSVSAPTPVSGGRVAHLHLGLAEGDAATVAAGRRGSIELGLFTDGKPGTVGGYLVDGWRFEIKLEN
ncbi:glyoxalase bleomycin resistance protein dioxygenase superfamily [Ophiostoma piceae UAMH 11346]|uniref:Glyoxalase bleomycin resistance protein dioxygenase superfamily n=1 Tax=Ophiostoma piceae (strain UAMH 11346) TaxID=1262450 RepID=S3BSF0_OPHP1|nr:glyoxalase bleomycin resistance protein dioxygenase superfamily [Ophiostoma piceae UAMH 11346]